MRRLLLLALVLVGGAMAQDEVTILPYPYPLPVSAYEDVKKFLNLTDPQVTSLTNIANSKNQAQENLWRQIRDKRMALESLLQSNSTDAARVGQLMIEINVMQRQTVPVEPYRSQSLNLLAPEQKAKLPTLLQALQIQNAAWQATTLNLIDSPDRNPIGLPAMTSSRGVPEN